MSEQMDFFIFLIEQYAVHKETSSDKIMRKLDDLNLTDLVFSMYQRYHTEAIENAFDDIDRLIEEASEK